MTFTSLLLFQRKYKEAGKKAATSSLYSTLPENLDTRHAREVSQLQSQVRPPSGSGPEWAGPQVLPAGGVMV